MTQNHRWQTSLTRAEDHRNDWIDPHEARADWSFAVATVLQRAACNVAFSNRDDFVDVIQALIADLPDPVCLGDRGDFARRLLEFSLRVGRMFHDRHHRDTPARCSFVPESISAIWFEPDRDPKELLRDWLACYLAVFNRAHPAPAAERAAKMIRDRPTQPLTIDSLARAVGVSGSVLKRQFAREYAMSPGEYRSRVRLMIGIAALQDPHVKVCEAASRAGYRSTTSFNVALKNHLNLTPTQARRAPIDMTSNAISSTSIARWSRHRPLSHGQKSH